MQASFVHTYRLSDGRIIVHRVMCRSPRHQLNSETSNRKATLARGRIPRRAPPTPTLTYLLVPQALSAEIDAERAAHEPQAAIDGGEACQNGRRSRDFAKAGPHGVQANEGLNRSGGR